jgi:hydroxymethylpyrimidine kinase/phosphomethylpyrimidine kinase/thiamine-phosphate diphosphorylase
MSMPVVWSIAGTDSGGGAGLSADQRAADAFGVHLCPVVSAITAQNSRTVTRIEPLPVEWIDAQLRTLAADMPPVAIKTGLLGGVAQLECVVRWVDRLRRERPVALVVDPVLAASTGAAFADPSVLQAYRELLLPRATLVTPNLGEARQLAGGPASAGSDADAAPALARQLRARGAAAVCLTGGDSLSLAQDEALDWLGSDHAEGWLAFPRIATANSHGTGCTFATAAAAALALGYVDAEAVILAKMATAQALRGGHAAGGGAGPVIAGPGFHADATLLPRMSWGEAPRFAAPRDRVDPPLGLYAIVDSAERLRRAVEAGVRTVQLRIKEPAAAHAQWEARLRDEITRSVAICRAAGAELFVNDHWTLALALGADGVHLGQEDLLALGEAGRAALQRSGLRLGVSSHSLWELCRARALSLRYIACGPVWPTLTKAMPWRPQGLDNLRWWHAMANAPVVAIGGILQPDQVRDAARCGVAGVCVVRALGDDASAAVPVLNRALAEGAAAGGAAPLPMPMPHPSLAAPERP